MLVIRKHVYILFETTVKQQEREGDGLQVGGSLVTHQLDTGAAQPKNQVTPPTTYNINRTLVHMSLNLSAAFSHDQEQVCEREEIQ